MAAFLEGNMAVLRAIAEARTPLLDSFFALITHIGEETAFMVVLMFIFWCVDKRRGYYLMMIGFAGTVINQTLKIIACIPRPWGLDPNFKIVEAAREQATGYSFPSGHTQNIVGTFGGIAKTSKRRWMKAACITLAVLVSFSRLYLGVHTPFDVGVSVVVALVLIFALVPVCKDKNKSLLPAWTVMTVTSLAYLLFAMARQDTALVENLTEEDLANFASAVKTANCMLGASIGGLASYVLDERFTHFETKAVWWAQALKLVLGLTLVVAVKGVLKAPLYAVFGTAGDIVRYGVMILFAGAVWPLTFRFFARLGSKAAVKS